MDQGYAIQTPSGILFARTFGGTEKDAWCFLNQNSGPGGYGSEESCRAAGYTAVPVVLLTAAELAALSAERDEYAAACSDLIGKHRNADKDCHNCKHRACYGDVAPCVKCLEEYREGQPVSLWEPRDAECFTAHEAEVAALRAEIERLLDTLHTDRSGLARGLTRIREIVESWSWVNRDGTEHPHGVVAWEELCDLRDEVGKSCEAALRESGKLAHAECCGRGERVDYVAEIERLTAALKQEECDGVALLTEFMQAKRHRSECYVRITALRAELDALKGGPVAAEAPMTATDALRVAADREG